MQKTMNATQRVRTVFEGALPDRVPVCLHNFLAAAREAGISQSVYREDPEAIIRAHVQAYETYGHDCIMVDLDTTMLAEAMGAKSDSQRDEPGHIAAPAISDLDDVGSLRVIDPYKDGRLPVILEAVRGLRVALGDAVCIRGNCDQAAFSLACLLRGSEDLFMDLAEDPDDPAIEQLLEVAHQSHLALHRAVAGAGADLTSLGDSFCGPDVVSPSMFRRFSKPYEQRLVRELAQDGIQVVIHVCGDTNMILEDFAEYPFCGFELDYKTDSLRAKETVGRGHVLFGNIDPSGIVGHGTPGSIREACRQLFEVWKPGGGFILNAGCAIPAGTPPENIHALVAAAAEFGRYE
jgi:uroporphyrinogen decarboxylase